MTQKIIYLKGLPASGKSTRAKQHVQEHGGVFKRVSKDDLRAMIDCGVPFSKILETTIVGLERDMVDKLLSYGHSVIVDNTGFNIAHENHYRALAATHQAEFEVRFFDTPIEICIARDGNRPDSVGRKVIEDMYARYRSQFEPPFIYTPDTSKPKAIIVDIDGTLAKMVSRGPFDWHKVGEDEAHKDIVDLYNMYFDAGYKMIILSGRDEICREKTAMWLVKYIKDCDKLLMRKNNDNRKDSIIKLELFKEICNDYNIVCAIDDRQQVVDLWRSIGLRCLQVAPGNF